MAEYGFGPPAKEELIVFGAQRPGYHGKFVQKQVVDEWLAYMKKQEIAGVVCLLSEDELKFYPTLPGGLLGYYAEAFGADNVLWAPTPDLKLPAAEAVRHILKFLQDAAGKGEKVVVHCSGGIGRTGVVLAAWLVYARRETERMAIKAVKEQNRNPLEAVLHGTAKEPELMAVLAVAREMEKPS
jgi:hypothetical protein